MVIRKRYLFVLFGCMAVVLVIVWMATQAKSVGWALDRVGGERVLSVNGGEELNEDDSLFMDSLKLRPSLDGHKKLRAVGICKENTESCFTRDLVASNYLSGQDIDGNAAEELMGVYRRKGVEDIVVCPAKYEISRMLLESSALAKLSPKDASHRVDAVVEKIKSTGGMDFSIETDECKKYFESNPHLARAYLAELALIMSFDKHVFSLGWVYLFSKSGVYSVLN